MRIHEDTHAIMQGITVAIAITCLVALVAVCGVKTARNVALMQDAEALAATARH